MTIIREYFLIILLLLAAIGTIYLQFGSTLIQLTRTTANTITQPRSVIVQK